MIRVLVPFFAVLISVVHGSTESKPLIAFERGDSIWVANADGSGAKRIAKGSAPSMSADGTRVAFHTDTSTAKQVIRQIAVAEIASRRVVVFEGGIPSRNCMRAVWSPDGTLILFNIFSGSNWNLVVINSDGSGFRYIRKASPNHRSMESDCWAPDGRSIYGQDLDNLYQLALDGSELKQWSLHTLFPEGSLSSESIIAVSPDGNRLLIGGVEIEDKSVNVTDEDGYTPTSMWILDLASSETSRLTPKGISAWHGCWINDKQVLFTSQAADEKQPSVYQMSVSQKDRKPLTLIKNANNPTVSR